MSFFLLEKPKKWVVKVMGDKLELFELIGVLVVYRVNFKLSEKNNKHEVAFCVSGDKIEELYSLIYGSVHNKTCFKVFNFSF